MSDATARPADIRSARSESLFVRNLLLFATSKLSLASAVVVIAFMLMAIAAPLFAPHDPTETDLFRRLQPPAWMDGLPRPVIGYLGSIDHRIDPVV